MSAAQYSQRATDLRWLAGQTTDERAQRVLIELAMDTRLLPQAATSPGETLQPAEPLGVRLFEARGAIGARACGQGPCGAASQEPRRGSHDRLRPSTSLPGAGQVARTCRRSVATANRRSELSRPMRTLIIATVALGPGLLSSPTFASVVDPDPAGIGTYLVSAVLLASGIAIFLYHLIGEARANRGQEQDGRERPSPKRVLCRRSRALALSPALSQFSHASGSLMLAWCRTAGGEPTRRQPLDTGKTPFSLRPCRKRTTCQTDGDHLENRPRAPRRRRDPYRRTRAAGPVFE